MLPRSQAGRYLKHFLVYSLRLVLQNHYKIGFLPYYYINFKLTSFYLGGSIVAQGLITLFANYVVVIMLSMQGPFWSATLGCTFAKIVFVKIVLVFGLSVKKTNNIWKSNKRD